MTIATNDPIYGKFKFLEDPTFARHPKLKNEPCYRLIFCHAIFECCKNNDWDYQIIESELEKLSGSYNLPVQDSNCIYYLSGYMEIYKYKFKNEEYGYQLVDKTGGIYPLVFYPYPNSSYLGQPAKERAKAFRAALDDVALHKRHIIVEVFKKYKNWKELQLELNNIFHGDKRNKNAA